MDNSVVTKPLNIMIKKATTELDRIIKVIKNTLKLSDKIEKGIDYDNNLTKYLKDKLSNNEYKYLNLIADASDKNIHLLERLIITLIRFNVCLKTDSIVCNIQKILDIKLDNDLINHINELNIILIKYYNILLSSLAKGYISFNNLSKIEINKCLTYLSPEEIINATETTLAEAKTTLAEAEKKITKAKAELEA